MAIVKSTGLKATIAEIAARATPLGQSLAALKVSPAAAFDSEKGWQRLEQWQTAVAGADPLKFELRLAAAGLTRPTALRLLGTELPVDPENLPAWANLLAEVLEGLAGETPAFWQTLNRHADRAIPFQEILFPFVLIFRRRLDEQWANPYQGLSETAQAALEKQLLETLADLAAQTLAVEFAVFKAEREPLWFFNPVPLANPDPTSKPSKELYTQFVEAMLAGQLVPFFKEYSALARLLTLKTGFYVEATAELLARLEADRSDLENAFGKTPGQIVNLKMGKSDPHHAGRSVACLEFASGLKLIYKPRDLSLEAAFQDCLAWCNRQGLDYPFKIIRYLSRPGYGWVEFVEHLPCTDLEQVGHFYRRVGQLLAVLHLLKAKDYHYENLIACGEHPLPIDQEALLAPLPAFGNAEQSDPAMQLACQLIYKSVLAIGLLPAPEEDETGVRRDMSALGEGNPGHQLSWVIGWNEVNTDRMAPKRLAFSEIASPGLNRPVSDGRPVPAASFLSEIKAGFEKLYQVFSGQSSALLVDGSPFTCFQNLSSRFVMRDTRIYGTILNSAFKPQYLRTGFERSLYLDRLSKAFLVPGTPPAHWQILEAELAALEQLDIPFFSCLTAQAGLALPGGRVIEDFFSRSGYVLLQESIANLGEPDKQLQLSYISAAMESLDEDLPARRPIPRSAPAEAVLSPARLVNEAEKIARLLGGQAVRQAGSATWIFTEYNNRAGNFKVNPVDFSLYSGVAGVALFYSGLAGLTGDNGYRELALAAWQPLKRLLGSKYDRQAFIRQAGLGGGTGFGSLLYPLALGAKFLEEPALADLVAKAAVIPLESLQDDKKYDLIFGAAGAIMGLLAAYRLTGQTRLLGQAAACGQYLLAQRQPGKQGWRAWPTIGGKLGTGFSHGAAGIACALLRLYEAGGDKEFLAAGQEAIAYENSLFSPDESNWPYLFYQAEGTPPVYWSRWCHGAPGIGLGRLASLAVLDTPEIRRDIEAALVNTQQTAPLEIDHLCCGNFGLIELLVKGQLCLDRPDLGNLARQWASEAVFRAGPNANYTLFPGQPAGLTNAGFFQGISGIGYELLRVAYPDKFPSVLLWEY